MTLSDAQRILVEENMGLVGDVMRKHIHNRNDLGSFDYEDLFQIGCIGLSKAANSFDSSKGKFSSFAFIVVRNEIFKALTQATKSFGREQPSDIIALANAQEPEEYEAPTIKEALITAKAAMPESAAKGVDAILLMNEGYTCREIGEMYGVDVRNVTTWISRARGFLRKNNAFMDVVADA